MTTTITACTNARRTMARTLRRMAHGAVDDLGLPTCGRDIAGATAAYAGMVHGAAKAKRAAFPTSGGDGWSFVPDTTPAAIVPQQRYG